MEKKIFEKILAILMIVMLISTDFFVLGSSLISYAATLDSSTNNENIEFSAYFKDENGERVPNISDSIKKNNYKLYAEVKVKNEGYFNGSIELQESNFRVKNNILSNYISSIEANKIELKQINAGNTVELELDVEPVTADIIDQNMLSMDSTIKLSGEYVESEEKFLTTKVGKSTVEATKTVKANFEVDESAEAELVTDIITNNVMSVKGTNKRVVQLLIKSRLTENQYPVNQTVLEVEVPSLSDKQPELVKVFALGTKATNANGDHVIENFINENGKITITLKNEPSENKITWNKNVYDELVVTLIYAEDVDASLVEIKTNSEIKLYNSLNTYTATYTKGIENKTLNNTISTQVVETSSDVYKGQLYVNAKSGTIKEIEYKTNTKLNITNIDVADKIVLKENVDMYGTESTELAAKTKFTKTQINKAKMLEILGQDGTIQINDGTNVQTLSKDTEANESGNIEITYTVAASELEITIGQPVKEGTIEISHTKAIVENMYTTEQLRTIKKLILRNSVKGMLGENEVIANSTEGSLELKETETKAELTVNKESLSTMTTNNEVILGVKLITNGEMYDLYKNPKIQIQLPSYIEEVIPNGVDKLYADNFGMQAAYNKTTKMVEIVLAGEQIVYPVGDAEQTYLQFNLNLRLSKLQPSITDKIVMTYTNENAVQYAGGRTDFGIVEKQINIVSPIGLIPVNNIETYNIEGISGISENKQVAKIDKNTAGGTDVKYNISLINNTKSDAKNVRILGVLPTEGEFVLGTETIKNTLTTTLKSITAEGATIYYSSNMNATADISDTNNGWNSNLAEVTNPKAYLIVVENITAGSRYDATYTVTLPETLNYDLSSYAGYKVLFNEGTNTSSQEIQSTLAGIATGTSIKLEANLSATVGNDIINNGDTVKAGEVINYTVTVKNNGTETLEKVIAKVEVPEGMVYIEPIENSVYAGVAYYEEKTDVKKVTKVILKIQPGEEYKFNYELRANMDITEAKDIINKVKIIYETNQIESNELKIKLSKAKIRATIKSIVDEDIELKPNGTMRYLMFIENMTNEDIKDLEFEILSEGLTLEKLQDGQLNESEIKAKNKINKISANDKVYYTLVGKINKEDISQIAVTIKVKDDNNNIYRSNKIVNNIEKLGATINMTSPTNGEYVESGDKVIYNIEVKNNGTTTNVMNVISNIPEYLTIQQIIENGEIKMQTTDKNDEETYVARLSNNLKYNISVETETTTRIEIVTQVRKIEDSFETKTITNTAQVLMQGKVYDTSEEVTHIVKGNSNEDIQNIVTGIAWLDENRNGKKDAEEKLLSNIDVKLFDITSNSIAKDKEGKIAETRTNDKGEYVFTKIENGKYIVLFNIDRVEYELTEYMKEGVSESQNSNAVLKSIVVDGQEQIYAVTDTINLYDNISNINIGLKEKLIFDLELNKYISRIVVQNNKTTKAKEYNNSVFQKIEINRKQINNSMVVLEYTIKVTNTGEIAGTVNSIVDYLPKGLEFSSELNQNWYLMGDNLHTKSLANETIQPGESKEIKLILTKNMTEDNLGLINNRAEIEASFNEYGELDHDSTVNNAANGEDDLGYADVLISISTGGRKLVYTLMIMINTALIAFAIYLIFKRNKIRKNI